MSNFSSEPFYGVCNHCKKRKLVRLYRYNSDSLLGVYCDSCYERIDSELLSVLNRGCSDDEGW